MEINQIINLPNNSIVMEYEYDNGLGCATFSCKDFDDYRNQTLIARKEGEDIIYSIVFLCDPCYKKHLENIKTNEYLHNVNIDSIIDEYLQDTYFSL